MNVTKSLIMGLILLGSHENNFTKKASSHNTHKGTRMLKTGEQIAHFKDFTTLANGIKFYVVTAGSKNKPLRGETVTVHYTGWLLEGKDTVGAQFDSSVDRGQKFQFPLGLGHVITGWDQMVADMNIGEKRIVILPPALAYGSRGAGNIIKPNSTLIFEIELFDSK